MMWSRGFSPRLRRRPRTSQSSTCRNGLSWALPPAWGRTPTLVTSIVFAEAGERVSTDGDQQVRYKGFHDAYLCAARVVEDAAQYTSKENADAIRESGLGDTLRRMALEVKEAAIKRLLRSTPP